MPLRPELGRTPLAWRPERRWFNLGAWILIADLVFAFIGYEYRLLPVPFYNAAGIVLFVAAMVCIAVSGVMDVRELERRRTKTGLHRFAYYGAFARALIEAMGVLQRIALLVVMPITVAALVALTMASAPTNALIVVLATGIVVFLALYLIDARRQRRRPSRWS